MTEQTHEEYLRETIEKESVSALDNAKWLAEHTVRFLKVTYRNEKIGFIGRVRRAEEFYTREWVGSGHVSLVARENFDEALTIMENVERIIKKLGRKAEEKIGE
jgi:hypothetical protein